MELESKTSHLGGHLNKTHVDLGSLKAINSLYGVNFMVDIGCGPGDMVREAQSMGIRAVGIDGDTSLADRWEGIPVIAHDFRKPFAWDGEYDLAWSVEFLEHVEEEYMENFLPIFCKAKYIMCTAAPPGTPGHHHVNCREKEYWIDIFESRGYTYDEEDTKYIKQLSTMRKPFIKNNGMFFRR